MLHLGVLCSGSGTNLQAILDACASGSLAAEVRLVLCNRAEAKALARAEAAGVPSVMLSHKQFDSREAYDSALVAELRKAGVDLVVLAGFMRIVTPVLLDAFPDRVINIHPALLPSFPGFSAQQQALDAGVTVSGCTVHFVDAGTDTGPIIAQAAVPVLDDDDLPALTARTLRQEHKLMVEVLRWLSEGRVHLERAEGKRPRVRVAGKKRAFWSDDP